MLDNFIERVLAWRVAAILGCLMLTVASGWGLNYLQPITDYRSFFAKDNPQLIAFNQLNDTFSKSESVFIVIHPHQGTVFTEQNLTLLKELTDRGWMLPRSTRVDSLVNFQHSEADEDSLMVRELIESTEDLTAEEIERIRKIVLNETQLLNKLVSPDGTVAGVNVIISLPDQQGSELQQVAEAARALKAEFAERYPQVDFYLSGFVEYNYATEEIIRDEMKTLVPVMLLLVLILLGLVLRSVYATLVTLVVILCSITTGMGLMGWLGWPLTSASSGAPTIILTMAVADCVHILVTYYINLREGQDQRQAMVRSLRINFSPVFITSLTTAIGFLSMNFSDLPPFNVLGNVVALGVVAAFVFSLTLLPAMMLLLPSLVKPRTTREARLLDPFAHWVVRRERPLFFSLTVLILVIVACIPMNRINDNFLRFIDQGHETRDATDYINDNLSSFYSIEFGIESPYEGGIYNPEFLRHLEQFTVWLKQQPEVSQVMTITDIFKRLNQNMHADDVAWYRLPEERELAAQYMLLYELSLPFGLDLNNQISLDKKATRLIVNLTEQSTSSMLALEKKYRAYLQEHFPQSHYFAGSTTLMFAHAGVTNAIHMVEGSVLALLVISAILVLALRSLRIGLISVIPNLVPAGLAFGLWALLSGEVGISIAIAIGMTLGIVVDNTVHFLSKYVRVRREQGYDAGQAVIYSFSNVGIALLVTNVILIAGFLVLSHSQLALNSQMGLFTALTFVLALIVDFLYLPALLLRLDRRPF